MLLKKVPSAGLPERSRGVLLFSKFAAAPKGLDSARPERVIEGLLLAVLLVGLTALGHPMGFHKKLTFTLTKSKVSALIVLDVDSGERCLLLREAMDSNRDGVLSGDEVAQLKDRLVTNNSN